MEHSLVYNIKRQDELAKEAINLLKKIISIPSLSGHEDRTADFVFTFLETQGLQVHRMHNNVWCFNTKYNPALPTVMLNSHHDTVKPNSGYSFDPYLPFEIEGKIFGLGSNDAGASLVCLLMVFLHFNGYSNLKYNLLFAATAEEEISGSNGIESILDELGTIKLAVVGEPTGMDLAVAEKGLMVFDCIVSGEGGHAAHAVGDNAIYKAVKTIQWFENFKFEKISEHLGEVKMTVTQIEAGTQHNIIPDKCKITVDVRTTDVYSNEEIFEIIKKNVDCELSARSFRLKPSSISKTHPFVIAGMALGKKIFASATISDQALLSCPSIKIGPGQSHRSHSSDEFILIQEIHEGISDYIKILQTYLLDV